MPLDVPPPLAPLVVEAPRLPPLAGEQVFSIETLEAADLRGAQRLDEALKRTPGVSLFRRAGSDAANPTIQGLSLRAIAPSGAGRALVTLDGAPQNDPFGGWVIWSALPPEGLAGGAVIRGAGAGPYGAGALTGVVALRETGVGESGSTTSVALSERGGLRGVAVLESQALLATVAASRSDGYRPVRGAGAGPVDVATTLRDLSASARLQGRWEGVDWSMRLAGFEERRDAGLVGAGSAASGGAMTLSAARPPSSGRSGDRSGWRAQAWVRASDLENRSVAVAPGRALATPANDQYATPALGYGLNLAWQGRAAPWSWEIGADLRAAEGEVRERFRFQNGAFTRGRIAGGETAVGGVYVETAFEGADLILAGGARLDGWRNTGGRRIERDLATGAVVLDGHPAGASGTTPTARLGAKVRLTGDLWARAAAYAGFRPPTLNELHRPFRVGNDVTEANGALKPETLHGLEAAISGAGPARWSLGVFYNRLDDPITNVTVGFGPGTFPTAGFIPAGGVLRQRRNAGAVDAWGLEADIAFELGPRLELKAALSASRSRMDGAGAAPQLTGLRPAQTPELSATAAATWRAAPDLSLEAGLRYESARFEDDLNTRKLAPAWGLDLRATWISPGGTAVFLALDNALDAAVEVGETADGIESYGAPRTMRIGISVRR